MKKQKSTLGIDWGSKYVGFAYVNDGTNVVMPVGYLMNDGSLFYNVGDMIIRHNVQKIIIGYPNKQEDVQEKIDAFIKQLMFIIHEDMEIIKQEEDYTTVQSGAKTGNFKKNEATDTLAAMYILERFLEKSES